MKQNKVLNGDLKPEHKKTTNGTTMGPTIKGIAHQIITEKNIIILWAW